MFKLITSLPSDSNNSKPSKKGSFIRFGANVEGEFDKELLVKVVPWILGISIAGGSAYGISSMIDSSNAVESKNSVNQMELMEYHTNLEKNSP